MYTNDNLDIIEDGQAFTHVNGTKYPSNFPKGEIAGLYPVTLTDAPTGDIVITGFHIDNTHTQVWDYRSKTAQELLSEKQALLDSIEPRQRELFSKHSDSWMAKKKRNDDFLTDNPTEPDDFNYTKYNKVTKWGKKVEKANNGITIDNTKEEIQARLDSLDALDASFPNIP